MFTAPVPKTGEVVRVRQRTWLVGDVVASRFDGEASRVALSCLDDDAAGEPLEVLWELEVDAEPVPEAAEIIDGSAGLDDPRMFGAYLHALRWNTVTSTDKKLLQAPFRAGIDLKVFQLEPLRKALALPKVNLFIADDVGLGKTIEAGLVLQELILRQRVDWVLVVAPPQVTLQWKEELEQRFGLPFELYDRNFVNARRRERGWGVNPWSTHSRFVVSYALLRGRRTAGKGPRTQHLELLINALKARGTDKTLLILDECHQAAPSTGSLYPVDSRTTQAVRRLANRFEHRLFLSATPHNGHSSSFSALLEMLDPLRFTRGVKIKGAEELAPVMVRRLKRDLMSEVDGLPERHLVDHVVEATGEEPEILLGHLLARYETLYRAALEHLPKRERQARALVFVNLHKRLLSSIRAFSRTLESHARGAERTLTDTRQLPLPDAPVREKDEDLPESEIDAEEDEWVEAASFGTTQEARDLLSQLRSITAANREESDARIRALASWLREHLCPEGRWNHRKVVVFTEYDDTLQWLRRTLPELLAPADCTDRIGVFHGGLGDSKREKLKKAFNTKPGAHPLRILLATDAAREGINLQAHCTDLFHYDLPWNPSRIEQRNGRIDRVLQPSPKVWCHYFVVPQRPEDRVLEYVARKLEVIRSELGSLSEVISTRLAKRMDQGIRDLTTEEVDRVASPEQSALRAQRELEGEGVESLRGDLESLRKQLDGSAKSLAYRAEHLEDVVDLGLVLDAGQGTTPVRPTTDPPTWTLPDLPATWNGVLASMREPRPEDKPPWYLPPVKPIAFRAAHQLDAEAVQLHLGHPLVKRLLTLFRSRGFAQHELSRITVIESTNDHLRRVVAFGRLALFGKGATRLHEEILAISARCLPEGVRPFAEEAERKAIDTLYDLLATAPPLHSSSGALRQVCGRCASDFAALWQHLLQQQTESELAAKASLELRGHEEAMALRELLERQRQAIKDTFKEEAQQALAYQPTVVEERKQFERDRLHMKKRLDEIDAELAREPEALEQGYQVVLTRFEPVGLIYLWPRS